VCGILGKRKGVKKKDVFTKIVEDIRCIVWLSRYIHFFCSSNPKSKENPIDPDPTKYHEHR
jgi:hypothetical protein